MNEPMNSDEKGKKKSGGGKFMPREMLNATADRRRLAQVCNRFYIHRHTANFISSGRGGLTVQH